MLVLDREGTQVPAPRPFWPRTRTRLTEEPDITFLNLNLMLVNADGTFDQQVYLPLGLLYLAACLEREGYNVELADYQTFSEARKFDAQLIVDSLPDPAPIVGISCMSNLLPFSIHVARAIKMAYPDRKVVLGGVGPSPVAREIISTFPFIDAVVEGEGEVNMLEIMRGNGSGYLAPRVPTDLDALPMPAYSLIDFKRYDAAPSVITSRGCPYKCTFCTEPYNFAGRVRFRDVDEVVEEVELVHALSGRTMFLFQDDILPLKPSRFRRLLAGFRKLSFPIQWKCFSRVDLMTDDLMQEMADSGCVQVRYGIESGSNKTLERIKKEFTIEPAYDVALRSLKHFPSVHVSFIWGYPFEEVAEFEETLHWVSRFEDSGISVLLFEYSPLPGSPMYQAHREGLTFSPDRYSFYVVTGHEVVKSGRHAVGSEFGPIYQMIVDHPEIFSGFYQYESTKLLALRQRLVQYQVTRRTRVKNEYDL